LQQRIEVNKYLLAEKLRNITVTKSNFFHQLL